MTSTTPTKLPNNNHTVDSGSAKLGVHDLQLLLRPQLGDQFVVLKAHVSSLLPPGENFACSIFKVDATVKRANNESEETLHLIAKTFPLARNMLEIFDYSKFFKKEIFFYEKIAKMYNELEREFEAQELLDIAPKLYGAGSTSTKGTEKNKLDESVVILMENLKTSGYYTLDKIEGLDLNHSRLAIRVLARFHALGIACKHHRPSFFASEVLRHAQVVPFQEREGTGDIFDLMYEKLMRDPRIAPHGERISNLFLSPERRRMFFEYLAPEPWLSVTHFDFWTNNILYHKDEEGNLDGIKFIDFQNYAYNSPLRDVPYFLCTSTKREVMMDHFEELLDLYYETFIGTLKRMKINVEKFSRESFDEQLKTDAEFEFFHNILAIKFFCAEIDKNTYDQSQIEAVVICSDVNQMGYDKWYDIVTVYLKKGWL